MPLRAALLFGVLFAPLTVQADEATEAEKPKVTIQTIETDGGAKESAAAGDLTITHGSVEIAGRAIAYTATAGTLPLLGDDGKKKADVFFVAYTADGGDAKRPVTFAFNGGPGSSSVWLHLGLLGPKRVALPDNPVVPVPPTGLKPNEFSLLDKTDLVFIDPVSTGYSRPVEGEKKEQFHGYKEDLDAVGRFIHLYTTRYGRWGSPKFLFGESYGTTRAAGLSEHLRDRYNLELNGIALVSTVLDFQTISFSDGNDLSYVLFLPSYAATAWYHKQLGAELQKQSVEEIATEARAFALGDYATALLKGDSLPKADRKKVAARMAELTGLSRKFVERSDLRVSMGRFGKELLRRREQSVGRFDGRYIGDEADAASDRPEDDPSAAALFGPFTAALYQYLRDDLNVRKDVPYEILTGKVHPWNYGEFTNRYVRSADALASAMAANPHLKVFVANGYYDLATPFAAAEHTFDHLDPPQRRKNVTLTYYEAGHMMYVHEPSLRRLRHDLVKFYAEAVPGK